MTDAVTAPTSTGDAGAAAPAATPTPAAATPAAPAAPATPAPVAPAPTLADGGGKSDPPATPAAAAGSPAAPTPSWRERIAGADKDFQRQLERYASEEDFGKAYRAAQRKISEGAHKKPGPPEGATEEDLKAWRKDAGLPETWERYTPKLPDGLVLGTEDKPVVDLFAQYAHRENMTEEQFNSVLGFYYTTQDALRSMRQDADQQHQINAEDGLRKAYGQDYRRNMNALGNFRDRMPDGLSTRLLAGRMADGTMIGNDSQFIQWMVATALDLDPASTLVPTGGDSAQSIGDSITQIETVMKTDPQKYWKDSQMQQRYRELLEVRDKIKARAA
jgi:hypothetical protein